jgi:hypothetical protein
MSELSFIKPAPYGDIKFDTGAKSAELTSSPNTKLISPYDGVVVFDQTPNCRNMIKIQHEIDDEVFYSVFCGVEKINVSFGEEVRQGGFIGKFSDDKVEYYIVDEQDNKQLLSKFFNRSKNKNSKTTTTTTTKKPISFDTDKTPNPGMDLALLPLSGLNYIGGQVKDDVKKLIGKSKEKVKSLFTKKEKENNNDDDDETNLTEEIIRIQNLLK